MKKDVNYYLSVGLEPAYAAYFAAGRRQIVDVKPNPDFSLSLLFDNGERRRLYCTDFLKGERFSVFRDYARFRQVYLDDSHSICWDFDPNVDSDVVWNNKCDLCPDVCYVESIPEGGASHA